MNTSTKGQIAEMQAQAYFLEKGYFVFPNIITNGASIDIVTVNPLTGETALYDVKTISITLVDGKEYERIPKLKEEQIRLGVRLVKVYQNGKIIIE